MSQLQNYLNDMITEKEKINPYNIDFMNSVFGINGKKVPDKWANYGLYVGEDGNMRYDNWDTSQTYRNKLDGTPNSYGFFVTDVYLKPDGKVHIVGGNTGEGPAQYYGEHTSKWDTYDKITITIAGYTAYIPFQELIGQKVLTANVEVNFECDIDFTAIGTNEKLYNNPIAQFVYSTYSSYRYVCLQFHSSYYDDKYDDSTYPIIPTYDENYNHLSVGKTLTLDTARYACHSYNSDYQCYTELSGTATGIQNDEYLYIIADLYMNNTWVGSQCYYVSVTSDRQVIDTTPSTIQFSTHATSAYGVGYDKNGKWTNYPYHKQFNRVVISNVCTRKYIDNFSKSVDLALDTTTSGSYVKVNQPTSMNMSPYGARCEGSYYGGRYYPYGYKTGENDADVLYLKTVGYVNGVATELIVPDVLQYCNKNTRTNGGSGVWWWAVLNPNDISDIYLETAQQFDTLVTYVSENSTVVTLTYQELVDGGYLEPDPPTPPTPGEGISCFVKYPLNIIDPEGTITDAESWFNNNWMSIYARQSYDYNGDYPVGTEKCNIQLSKDSSRASEATMDENYLYYPAYIYIAKETKTETGWNHNSTSYYSNQEPYITSEILTEFDRLLSLSDMRPESVWINEHSYYPSNINDNVIPGTFDLGNMIDGAPLEVARRTYYDRMDELVNVLLAGEDMTLYHCPPLSAIKEYNQTHNNENEE